MQPGQQKNLTLPATHSLSREKLTSIVLVDPIQGAHGGVQDFASSLVCFMMEYMYWEGKPITEDAGIMQRLTRAPNGKDMAAWCLHFEHSTRICSLRANKVTRMTSIVLPILPSIADREKDIVILNFGQW